MKKVLLIFGIVILITSCAKNSKFDDFAQCLTEKGVKMYGALGCTHCGNAKNKFGDSFKYVNYIECNPHGPNPQPELCIQNNIEYYPTWEFSDGSRLLGDISFYDLHQKTGCVIDG